MTRIFIFWPIVLLHSTIDYRHHNVVCMSVFTCVCSAVEGQLPITFFRHLKFWDYTEYLSLEISEKLWNDIHVVG